MDCFATLAMTRLVLLLALLLSACHDKRPLQPTAEQAAQLNDAEDMLNGMGNEEGPADRSTGPSNNSD